MSFDILPGNSVIVVAGHSTAPPALLLAQLLTSAGLPAGALNVLTGSDMTLGAKVAHNPNVSYVTYAGNKQVRACARVFSEVRIPVKKSIFPSVSGRSDAV